MKDYKLDLRMIDLVELKKLGIKQNEIYEVLTTSNTIFIEYNDFSYAISYLERNKFLHIAFLISNDRRFDFIILQVDIPNESDIKKIWCPNQTKDELL